MKKPKANKDVTWRILL